MSHANLEWLSAIQSYSNEVWSLNGRLATKTYAATMNGQPPYASHGRYGQPSSEPYGDSYTPDPSALGDAGPGDYPSARRVGGGRGGGGGGTGDSGYGGLGADPFEENAQRPRSRNNVEAPSRPRYGRGLTVGRDDRSYSDSNRSRDRNGRGLEERSTTQSNSRSQQSMEGKSSGTTSEAGSPWREELSS